MQRNLVRSLIVFVTACVLVTTSAAVVQVARVRANTSNVRLNAQTVPFFTITNIASNNLIIDATASVRQVQQSFHVQMNTYRLGNNMFFANDEPPSVPTSISSLITSISGLDNSTQYHPSYHRALHATQSGPLGGL